MPINVEQFVFRQGLRTIPFYLRVERVLGAELGLDQDEVFFAQMETYVWLGGRTLDRQAIRLEVVTCRGQEIPEFQGVIRHAKPPEVQRRLLVDVQAGDVPGD